MSHISCCATVFSHRQLQTCFHGGEPAGPHIDLSAWWGSANHDLLSLAPSVAMEVKLEQHEVGLLQLNRKNNFYLVRTDCDTNPLMLLNLLQNLLLLLQSTQCICLYAHKPLEKMNIPQSKNAESFACPPSLIHTEPFVTHTLALMGVAHSTERNSLLRAESAETDLWLYLY